MSAYPRPPYPVRQNRSLVPWVIAGAAVVFAVVSGAVLAVVCFLQHNTTEAQRDTISDLRKVSAERDDARKTACDYLTAFTSYEDGVDIDRYFATLRAGATGHLKEELTDTLPKMRELMVQARSHSTSEGIRCGIESIDAAKATVVVTGKLHASALGTGGVPAGTTTIAGTITIERQPDGRWLSSAIDFVSGGR